MKKALLTAVFVSVLAIQLHAEVTVDTVNVYDSRTDKGKVVLEVCYSDRTCDKLILDSSELKSKSVEEWFAMVIDRKGAK